MAVSYGATFPVIVLLLSIAFTGYLEVKKTWCYVFNQAVPFNIPKTYTYKYLCFGTVN